MVNVSGAPRAAEASAWICGAGIQDRINGDPWNSTQRREDAENFHKEESSRRFGNSSATPRLCASALKHRGSY